MASCVAERKKWKGSPPDNVYDFLDLGQALSFFLRTWAMRGRHLPGMLETFASENGLLLGEVVVLLSAVCQNIDPAVVLHYFYTLFELSQERRNTYKEE